MYMLKTEQETNKRVNKVNNMTMVLTYITRVGREEDNLRMKCSAPPLKVDSWLECHEEGNTTSPLRRCRAGKSCVMICGAEHVTTIEAAAGDGR